MPNSIDQTNTQSFTFNNEEAPFELNCGEKLTNFTLAYEIYGQMSQNKDNVILLFHALSASQHAAGFTENIEGLSIEWDKECQTGWWNDFIGSGKALDTDKYCVICANYLGGCYGSTGPSSINPETGKPFGGSFPRISIKDIVKSQVELLNHLEIKQLHAVAGSSLGGLMAVSLATQHPERVRTIVALASGIKTSVLQRIHNLEQITAIESDSNFLGGNYYSNNSPEDGLALARMIGHKVFISLATLERRASQEVKKETEESSWYQVQTPVESYMRHQGQKFVKRFDANTYLRIMDAWQNFNILDESGFSDYSTMFSRCSHQKYLIFTINSDVCFYPDQQEELVSAISEGGINPMHITVHSEKGHDSFLLEPDLYAPHIHFALDESD
ncbi:homoserine O-acetyltransferase [Verrucomicrobiales bacterium]|nr:homoserine O-acetyltransferase [Verrucomicrobiales bacterium]NCG28779.1 homoserine O-acetyltransferase [Verrucomicrobiales bacterium]